MINKGGKEKKDGCDDCEDYDCEVIHARWATGDGETHRWSMVV